MRIRWTVWALSNLDAEVAYIARDDPAAAIQVAQIIEDTVDLLQRHPALGRPGRVAGTRELIISRTPYIIPYRIRNNEIQILRVFHGARKWPSKF